MERIPASERTREKLKAVIEGTEKGAGASELVRLAARLIIEEALEGEARDVLGREYYARGAAPGAGYRNGYRTGRLDSAEGRIEYSAPQIADRATPFRSAIRELVRGRTAELEALAVEMYARGLSTRDIEALFADAEGAQHRAGAAGSGVAQPVALTVLLDFGLAQPLEVLHDIGPFEAVAGGGQSVFRSSSSLRNSSARNEQNMAANGRVVFVKDRAGSEQRLGRAKDVLDHPAVAVAQGDLQRGQFAVGAQHVDAVKERVEGDAAWIDLEAVAGAELEEAAIAAVADETL